MESFTTRTLVLTCPEDGQTRAVLMIKPEDTAGFMLLEIPTAAYELDVEVQEAFMKLAGLLTKHALNSIPGVTVESVTQVDNIHADMPVGSTKH